MDTKFIAKLQTMVDDDPSQSMRPISRELHDSEGKIRKCVQAGRYKIQVIQDQLLSAKMQENCFKRSKKLLD